jgi:hypothetical protein
LNDTTCLVLLEFSGVGRDQTLMWVIPERSPDRTMTIDPVEYAPMGAHEELSGTARRVADAVTTKGASRAVVLAACVAGNLAGPVADSLIAAGVEVPMIAAVAPQAVTSDLVESILRQLFRNLRLDSSEWPGGLAERIGSCTAQDSLEEIKSLISTWLNKSPATNKAYLNQEGSVYRELADRYSRWLGLLLSCMHAGGLPTRRLTDVFVPAGHSVPGLGSVRQHAYDVGEAPLLRSARLASDLSTALARAGWTAVDQPLT